MLSTPSFKQKFSAALLCLSLAFSQSPVKAATFEEYKPSANKQMLFLLLAPFIDTLYKNNKDLRSWDGIKKLGSLTKAHYKSVLTGNAITSRKADETKTQFMQRLAKENPALATAAGLALVSTLHAVWTDGATQAATELKDVLVGDAKALASKAGSVISEIKDGLPGTRRGIKLGLAAAQTAIGTKK
jgi:hypothetical protein